MKRTTPIDPQIQLERFRRATELLGGQRATARALDIGERTMRALVAGERALHDGYLRDTAAALIAHAEACRELERQISPAFVGNLTEAQAARQGRPDARRFDSRDEGED